MVSSTGRVGATLEGVGGLVVLAIGGVVFLPSYHGGVVLPLLASATGLALCGSALSSLDESRRTDGSALLLVGSVTVLAATAYAFLTVPGGVERVLAPGAACLGVVGATIDVLDARGWDRDVEPRVVQLGATSGLVAAVVLSTLPPASDEPFHTLLLVLAVGAAGYGAFVLGLALYGSEVGPRSADATQEPN